MTTIIELVITACLLSTPTECTEVRIPTPYLTPFTCEEESLLTAAVHIMTEYPGYTGRTFHCERVPEEEMT